MRRIAFRDIKQNSEFHFRIVYPGKMKCQFNLKVQGTQVDLSPKENPLGLNETLTIQPSVQTKLIEINGNKA